jgi:hypothetical protein
MMPLLGQLLDWGYVFCIPHPASLQWPLSSRSSCRWHFGHQQFPPSCVIDARLDVYAAQCMMLPLSITWALDACPVL